MSHAPLVIHAVPASARSNVFGSVHQVAAIAWALASGKMSSASAARPAEPWTLERLAAEVNLSRATLARRFGELVGEPPLAYLRRWRMELAARRLRDTGDPVEAIARDVGYTSAYAFNRAFRRQRGRPPGRYRRAA